MKSNIFKHIKRYCTFFLLCEVSASDVYFTLQHISIQNSHILSAENHTCLVTTVLGGAALETNLLVLCKDDEGTAPPL